MQEIVSKSDEALEAPTDTENLARTLREVKAHAASCLQTYLTAPSAAFADGGHEESKSDLLVTDSQPTESDPSEVESLETSAEQSAFAAAHNRLCLVGYGDVSQEEQDDIVENLLDEILMVNDNLEPIVETTNVNARVRCSRKPVV